ncbi:Smad nuclear-interacting protein 1 [Rhizophlyctis rosea]|nr:Smad nuclear-interacting protein 1 [Rhizophlyctis rosea]
MESVQSVAGRVAHGHDPRVVIMVEAGTTDDEKTALVDHHLDDGKTEETKTTDMKTSRENPNPTYLNHTAMASSSAPPEQPKEMPNYQQSGALAAEQNTYNGVVLKYSEPPEARKPTKKYRLYVYKGKDEIDLLYIHRQSAFLIGRERLVADLPIDHPSCSKQHAVLQFRQVVEQTPTGETTKTTKPYIIDLESTNGTYVNGERIPPSRYYELKLTDAIKFGFSSREYVLMSEDMLTE